MTTPTHTSAMPAGGILTQHVDQDFTDYVQGRPLTQRVCITVLQPAGIASTNGQKGRLNTTKYETVHLAEVTDPHEADRLRHMLTQLQADRGLRAKQPSLFDLTEQEQRESLLDMIRDHASEKDIPIKELDAQWVAYFGGPEHANSETVQASRSVAQLKEFAYAIGAIAETKPDEDDDAGDVDAEPDDEATPTPAEPQAPKKRAGRKTPENVVPFQPPGEGS